MDSIAENAKETLKATLRLHQIRQTILVIGFVCLFAFIGNKWVEAVLFCISHLQIRKRFNKQYHNASTSICMSITVTVAFFGIISTLPMSLSVLSAIPLVFTFSWVGCILQEKIDLQKYVELLKEDLENKKKITPQNIEEMFIKINTKQKYRTYLRAVLIDGMRDVDWFNLEENRYEEIDEMQYRRYKSKFLKNFPK